VRGYQLVVSGLGSFDSIICVDEALRRRAHRNRGFTADLNDVISSAGTRDPGRDEPLPTNRANYPDR